MRRIALAGVVVAMLALGVGPAAAQLSKALARNAAEITTLNWSRHKTWATDWKVGACRRRTVSRVSCEARVTGDRLLGCSEEYVCEYVFHLCRLTVAVHEAGWQRIGRVQGVDCRTRRYSG